MLVGNGTQNVPYERPYLYPKQHDAIFTNKRIGAIEASTKSGKTLGCNVWILEQMYAGKPGDEFFWVAPYADQTRIAYNNIIKGLPTNTFRFLQTPVPRIELLNGTTLYFKSGDNPDSLFGYASKATVIDEASRCRPESWEAVLSTLTATHGPVRVIGNVQGKRNWFYALCRRIENGLEPSGHYARITYLDAIEAGVITAESVEEERRNMPAAAFQELFEAIARDDSGNPFGEDHIYACIGDLSNQPAVAYGIDLAKKKDYLVVIGLDVEGRTCHFSRWQGIPWRASIRRIHEIVGEDTPALVDSTGIGDPVLEELQDGHGNFRGYTFTSLSKQRLMEGLAVSIQGREITYPDGPIKGELLSFEYEIMPTGVRYSAHEGEFDDCVCALAMAREQWTTANPGASLIAFYASQTKKGAETTDKAELPDGESDFVRKFTHVDSAIQLDNELTELYLKTMAEYDAPETRLCARCSIPVPNTNHVSDGFSIWHPECVG